MTDHADTMTTLWSELSRNLAAVEEVNKALLAQAKDGATDQKAREERLTRAVKTLEEQKKSHIDLYKTRSAAGAVSPEEEEAFWKTLSSQEDMIEAAQAKVDEVRGLAYFPAPTYTYRLGSNGTYIGIGDYWIGHLLGRIQIDMLPAEPASADTVPRYVMIRVAPVSLSILLNDLGLCGDGIPSALKHIRSLEVNLELDVQLPLAFRPVSHKVSSGKAGIKRMLHAMKGSSSSTSSTASAAKSRSSRGDADSIAQLARYEWQVMESFKFEVTNMTYKTASSISIPNTLLKHLVNLLVPPALKAGIVKAIPMELGVMLALHQDHSLSFAGEIKLESLPLHCVLAPLHRAVDDSLGSASEEAVLSMPAASEARATSKEVAARARHAFRTALGGHRMGAHSLHGHKHRTPAHVHAPPISAAPESASAVDVPAHSGTLSLEQYAARAAIALGLTARQARTFVAAQAAVPGNKGTAAYTTLWDIVRLVSQYNTRSRHRRQQANGINSLSIAAHAAGTHTVAIPAHESTRDLQSDARWDRVCELFQAIVDEFLQAQLAALSVQAAAMASEEQARQQQRAAQCNMLASHVNVRNLFAAAEEMYCKPLALKLTIHKLSGTAHAETLIGVWKAMSLRGIREKQVAVTGKTASHASPIATAADGSATPTRKSAGSATAASGAPASTSLLAQEEEVITGAANALDMAHMGHSLLSHLGASINGWVTGGDKGRVSLIARQVQAEAAPGIRFPVSMSEGFFPPGTSVNVMESRDETAAAFRTSADQHAPPHAGASLDASASNDQGRGTFSVMLAFPKETSGEAAAAAPADGVQQLKTGTQADPKLPLRAHLDDDAHLAQAADTLVEAKQPTKQAAALRPEDVEVVATVRLHRVWAGLQLDEAGLLSMIQRRASATTPRSRAGPPPLHALEIGLRPATLGSSYDAVGMDAATVARLAAEREDVGVAPVSEGAHKPRALPYIIGIEMPRWIRLKAEVQSLEAFGDVPILLKQVQHMLHSALFAAAATAVTDHSSSKTRGTAAAAPAAAGSKDADTLMTVTMKEGDAPADSSDRARASTAAAAGKPGDALASLPAAAAKDAAVVASAASSQIASRIHRYLNHEDLRISCNLSLEVTSQPAPPMLVDLDEVRTLRASSDAGSGSSEVSSLPQVVADIAVVDSKPVCEVSPTGSGRVQHVRKVFMLSVGTNAAHTMPSIIPEPGCAADAPVSVAAAPSARPTASSSTSAHLAHPPHASAAHTAATGLIPVRLVSSDEPAAAKTAAGEAKLLPAGGVSGTHSGALTGQPLPHPSALAEVSPHTASGAAKPTSATRHSIVLSPVAPAPAFVLEMQLSLITLMDDLRVMSGAFDVAGAIKAEADALSA